MIGLIRGSVVCVVALFVAGCSITKTPYFQDITTYPERVDLADQDKRLRMNFLARYMMEADDRRTLLRKVAGSEIVQQWNYMHTSTAVQMTADASTGVLGSSLGQNLGNAVFVAGLLFSEISDGSMKRIGQAFLPEEFVDRSLQTEEDAAAALALFSANKLQKIADRLGWTLQCIVGCGTRSQVFEFDRGDVPLPEGYLYQPQRIIVKVYFRELVETEDKDAVSAMVGFPVKWKTPPGYTYLVEFFAEPTLDESGAVKLAYSEEHAMHYPVVRRNLEETRLGRSLLRMFHDTPYTSYGQQDHYPRLFFREGEIFSFYRNGDPEMIKLLVIEEPLGS